MLLLLLMGLAMLNNNVDSYRILGMLPATGKSHFLLFKPLMEGLAAQGHLVDVVSQFPSREPIKNYRDIISIPKARNNLTNLDLISQSESMKDNFTSKIRKICEYLDHPEVRKLINLPPTDPPYDAVVIEVLVFICY